MNIILISLVILENIIIHKKPFKSLAIFFIFLFFLGITYTMDMENYKVMYNNLDYSPDVIFFLLSKLLNSLNLEYYYLIYLYYVISIFLLFRFLNYFITNQLFVIVCLFIYTLYLHANQIRYFASFYLLLNMFIEKNNRKKIMIGLITLAFHKGIFPLFLFEFLKEKTLKLNGVLIVIFNIFIFSFFSFIKLLVYKITYFRRYIIYFDGSRQKDIFSWIYFIGFYFIWILFILTIHKILSKKKYFLEEEKYKILINLSILPFSFISLSYFFIDASYRYIGIFHIVILTYIAYILKYFDLKTRVILILITVLLSFSNYYKEFYFPLLIGRKSFLWDIEKTYINHKLLKNLY